MPTHNFWIGMSQEMQADLVGWVATEPPVTPVNFPLLENMNDETIAFFRESHDAGSLDKLFVRYLANSRNYRVWSFYVTKLADVTPVRDNLDALTSNYPQDFIIMGAWNYLTGEALAAYPSPPSLINFMPPTWDHDVVPPAEPIEIPRTELVDVNLLAGQAPREFIQ